MSFYKKESTYYRDVKNIIIDAEDEFNKLVGYGLADHKIIKENGSTRLNTGYERLEQSMKIILSTPVGTLLFMPDFGSKIPSMLFSNIDDITKDLIKLYARQDIEKHDPRIIVHNIEVKNTRNKIDIVIDYSPQNSNNRKSYVYSANLKIPSLDLVD